MRNYEAHSHHYKYYQHHKSITNSKAEDFIQCGEGSRQCLKRLYSATASYSSGTNSSTIYVHQAFLDIRSETQGEKTKTQAQKLTTQDFLPKTQNFGKFFNNLRRFLTKCNNFCLKSGKNDFKNSIVTQNSR